MALYATHEAQRHHGMGCTLINSSRRTGGRRTRRGGRAGSYFAMDRSIIGLAVQRPPGVGRGETPVYRRRRCSA
jgi:hypothetical protein